MKSRIQQIQGKEKYDYNHKMKKAMNNSNGKSIFFILKNHTVLFMKIAYSVLAVIHKGYPIFLAHFGPTYLVISDF